MAYSVAGDELDDSLESSMEKGQAALESYRKDLGLSTLHAQPLGNAAHGASSSDGVPCTQTGKKLVESGFRKKRQPCMYVRAPQTSRSRGTCRQLAMPSMLDAPRAQAPSCPRLGVAGLASVLRLGDRQHRAHRRSGGTHGLVVRFFL